MGVVEAKDGSDAELERVVTNVRAWEEGELVASGSDVMWGLVVERGLEDGWGQDGTGREGVGLGVGQWVGLYSMRLEGASCERRNLC